MPPSLPPLARGFLKRSLKKGKILFYRLDGLCNYRVLGFPLHVVEKIRSSIQKNVFLHAQ